MSPDPLAEAIKSFDRSRESTIRALRVLAPSGWLVDVKTKKRVRPATKAEKVRSDSVRDAYGTSAILVDGGTYYVEVAR